MRLSTGEFVWGLGDDSGSDQTVRTFKAFARRMYKSYCSDLADTNVFDQQMQSHMRMIQDRLLAAGQLTLKSPEHYGTLDLDTEYATTFKPKPAECVYFSVCGTGVPWNVGYCYDIGENIEPGVPVAFRKCYHQPIGYPAAGPPSAMGPSVDAGVTEMIRQMDLHNCSVIPWLAGGYSQGMLVVGTVLMRVFFGDLGRFKATYQGSVGIGNPMRQGGHTFPGCVEVPGQGIAQPNMHDTPSAHWDFANCKKMVNSKGDDFYATMDGEADDSAAASDSRAVWAIIRDGIKGGLSLVAAVAKLIAEPSFKGTYGAAVAAFYALDFFVVQAITPHTQYGDVQPIPGDPRDCWAVALDHVRDLVAAV